MSYTVQEILALRKQESKAHSDWRIEAREDFEFRDGQQWSQDDEATLEEQNRPKVTFNRIGPIVSAIKGMELNNRQEIRYIPRTQEDAGINEVYSAASKWVRDECHAEDEESDVFDDGATTGLAWGEWYVDYNADPDGQICYSRVPPLEMRWDPSAKRKNLADRKWDMREKWLDKDVIKEKWPKAKLEISGDHELADWMEPHDATQAWKYESNALDVWTNDKKDKYLVLHFQWREREFFYKVGDPSTGEIVELSETKYNGIKKNIGDLIAVKVSRWRYREKFIIGDEVLEDRDVPTKYWTRVPLTACREESTNLWYGIVRAMKDPQRWANKFFSQAMHIFNSNPKGGVMMEEDAVDDKLDFENKWADPSGVAYVKEGALSSGKILPKPMTGYPSGLDSLLQFAISSIRDVSGMNVEMLGLADREQSGVLEKERKQAALVILAPLLNSLRQHRKESGRILLGFMRKHIPEGKLIRILEKGQARYVPFVKDDETVKYDVIVDTAPSSPNVKMEVWQSLQNMLPALLKGGVPIPPSILDYSPLPESVVADWKQYIEQNQGLPPEVQKQMEQMKGEMEKLSQQNKQLMSKKEETLANLELKRFEILQNDALEREKIALEARNKEMEMQLKREVSAEEMRIKIAEIQTKYDIEIHKIREEVAAEKEKKSMEVAWKGREKEIEVQAEKELKRIEMGEPSMDSKEFTNLKDVLKEIHKDHKELLTAVTSKIDTVAKKLGQKIDSDNKMRERITRELEKLS